MPFQKGHKLWKLRKKHVGMLGKVHSEESKEKMSLSHKGQKAWNKGKTWSEETRNKIRLKVKETWNKEPYRMSIINYRKGKKHSEETKRKISQSMQGKKPTDFAINKSAALRRGKPLSADHKE